MKRFRLRPLPGHPIGFLASGEPVYPFLGAAKDELPELEPNEEDDEIEIPTDDEPDEVEEEDGAAYRPPTKAEWIKMQNSLMRANGSAKQRREALQAVEKELAELKDAAAKREADEERKALLKGTGGKKTAGGGGGANPALPDNVYTKSQLRQELARNTKETEDRVRAEYQDIAVNAAARAALIEAGVRGASVPRLVKLLDLSSIEFEDGEISGGLDDQIEELKTELPQLFKDLEAKPARRRAPAPKVNGSDRKAGDDDTRRLSTAERMARDITGARQ